MPGIFLLGPDALKFVVDQLNEVAGLHETLTLGIIFGDDIFFLHLLERLTLLLAGFDQGDAVSQHIGEFLDVGLGRKRAGSSSAGRRCRASPPETASP